MQAIFKKVTAALLFITLFAACVEEKKILISSITEAHAEANGGVINVEQGDVVELEVVVLPENAKPTVRYETDTDKFMVVSGLLYGDQIGSGTLTIRSTDGSGTKVDYVVNVIESNKKVEEILVPETINLTLNTKLDLSSIVSIKPFNASNKLLTYETSNPEAVSINQGMMSGIALGESVITIQSTDGSNITASITVKVVQVPVTGIDMLTTSKKLSKGEKFNLATQTKVVPANAGNQLITYSSSDPLVASVSETGMVESLKKGTATITAITDDGGFTASCEITVTDELLDRAAWTATPSHAWFLEKDICFEAYAMFDDDLETNVAMVKAGRSAGGITVPAEDKIFFIIDTKEENEFDYLVYRHRGKNASATIRVKQFSIYGSNTGTAEADFTLIKAEVPISTTTTVNTIQMDKVEKYRYVKVIFEDWDKASGNTIQWSELNLGLTDK